MKKKNTPKKTKTKKKNLEEIVKLFFEFGQLRRVPHIGFTLAGVKNSNNIAEHTLRTSQIGYILARMEGANANKVNIMCLFHDLADTRVNDHHRVENRYHSYFILRDVEFKAFKEQVKILPEKIKRELLGLINELNAKKTLEAKCAKDADYLEQAVSAKEYMDIGYKGCKNWLENIRKALKTKTAKKFLTIIENTDRNSWWKNLKRLDEVLSK